MTKGFAIKINYPQEIAADERKIAFVTASMARGLYVTPFVWEGVTYQLETLDALAVMVPGAAASFGMTITDVADLVWYKYTSWQSNVPTIPEPIVACHGDLTDKQTPGNAGYLNGQKWSNTLSEGLYANEEAAKKDLKKAKTDLARHKRNAAKYG